jgi:hypothetical protein
MDQTINIKEQERRNKIKSSLRAYFKTDKGIAHRRKLSESQKTRMANYGKFMEDNNNFKIIQL